MLPLFPAQDGACSCWKVAECDSPGKHPLSAKGFAPNGLKDATTDPERIRFWWKAEPRAGVGIACGDGLVVLDVDPRKGGNETLAALEARHGPLPRTLTVSTGGDDGGRHLYFAGDAGTATLGDGLDFRGRGAYVVAPPTPRPNGRRYLFRDLYRSRAVPVPRWMLNGHAEREPAPQDLSGVFHDGEGRFRILSSLAASLARRGLGFAEIVEHLELYNANHCRPPKQRADLERYARHVLDRGSAEGLFEHVASAQVSSVASDALVAFAAPGGPPWPTLDPEALHGLAGEFVRAVEPYSEADPAALLGSLLVMFGNAAGDGAHAVAESDRHPARLNVVVVGETSRSRKGTSYSRARDVLSRVDPAWAADCVASGLSSGEGLIAAVRDGVDEDDPGVADKRLFVFEPEFARVLAVAGREGNILSTVLRGAWDDGRLRVMTRKDPLRATGAHIGVLAHVTAAELTRRLSDTEMANGFANRFLYLLARRSKLLPRGESFPEDKLNGLVRRLHEALAAARRIGRMHRSEEAEEFWDGIYRRLADGPEGLVGAVTARAQAQCLRLSVAYALLDGSPVIEGQHVLSAYAVWEYAEQSAVRIFGDATGDPVADRLLEAIQAAGSAGLDFTAQRDLFGRHRSAEVARARAGLERRGLIVTRTEETGGRSRSVSYVATEATKATEGPVR
ncbi:MAG: bifunctional DNA primase/polymerase [Actinomycetota bacterium]|nr:bifunctional DNA primase/polymerase [Actinomycetota bacterium]